MSAKEKMKLKCAMRLIVEGKLLSPDQIRRAIRRVQLAGWLAQQAARG